ncbi:hypothetical protein ATANTOWER_005374 [Ataeniobius toweri]|uniref:Uncharacterized protein n=1 Tax=Ataeniobius toweri TaxID=208326 RepID=A0ABU7BLV0_9TELE|nr:hypothetical protein [Ataeniobius toweri]
MTLRRVKLRRRENGGWLLRGPDQGSSQRRGEEIHRGSLEVTSESKRQSTRAQVESTNWKIEFLKEGQQKGKHRNAEERRNLTVLIGLDELQL